MAVPMAFKSCPDPFPGVPEQQPVLVGCFLYLCDCKEMAGSWKLLAGTDTSRDALEGIAAAVMGSCCPCTCNLHGLPFHASCPCRLACGHQTVPACAAGG